MNKTQEFYVNVALIPLKTWITDMADNLFDKFLVPKFILFLNSSAMSFNTNKWIRSTI